jgi:hypothetical protein
MLPAEQTIIYNHIVDSVESGSGFFFVWIWRNKKNFHLENIVLNTTSKGIASLLLPGGRTTHSSFKIPLQINETSVCTFKKESAKANLFKKPKLIIWGSTYDASLVH